MPGDGLELEHQGLPETTVAIRAVFQADRS